MYAPGHGNTQETVDQGHFDQVGPLKSCTYPGPGMLYRGGEPDFRNPNALKTLLRTHIGFVVDLRLLDEIVEREVMARFDHRNVNTDVPEFAEGLLVPSCENMASFIASHVQDALGSRAQVSRVWLSESPTLWAEWIAD